MLSPAVELFLLQQARIAAIHLRSTSHCFSRDMHASTLTAHRTGIDARVNKTTRGLHPPVAERVVSPQSRCPARV